MNSGQIQVHRWVLCFETMAVKATPFFTRQCGGGRKISGACSRVDRHRARLLWLCLNNAPDMAWLALALPGSLMSDVDRSWSSSFCPISPLHLTHYAAGSTISTPDTGMICAVLDRVPCTSATTAEMPTMLVLSVAIKR